MTEPELSLKDYCWRWQSVRSTKYIADLYGVTTDDVREAFDRACEEYKERTKRCRGIAMRTNSWTEEEIEQATQLKEQGLSYAAISKAMGGKRTTVAVRNKLTRG